MNIADRWCHHKGKLQGNCHYNKHLQKSWNKYGEENFRFYIIEECSKENLDDREIYYINLYNTLDSEFGYNLKHGGQEFCPGISEEFRQTLSKSVKESYNNTNLKDKRREDALNQWANPEIKAKIMGKNNGMYGKTHTPEVRKKLSEINKGRVSPKRNTIPVRCVELDKVFECATIAAKELGICSSILEVCYGNRKTCGGYHWEFV